MNPPTDVTSAICSYFAIESAVYAARSTTASAIRRLEGLSGGGDSEYYLAWFATMRGVIGGLDPYEYAAIRWKYWARGRTVEVERDVRTKSGKRVRVPYSKACYLSDEECAVRVGVETPRRFRRILSRARRKVSDNLMEMHAR